MNQIFTLNYNCCYWDRFDELAIKKRQIKNCGYSNWQRQTFRKNIQSIEKVIWMKTSHDRNCFFKTFFFQPCKVKYYGFQGSVICLIFANLPFLAPISTITCIIHRFEVRRGIFFFPKKIDLLRKFLNWNSASHYGLLYFTKLIKTFTLLLKRQKSSIVPFWDIAPLEALNVIFIIYSG